jgi:hypothetical protein
MFLLLTERECRRRRYSGPAGSASRKVLDDFGRDHIIRTQPGIGAGPAPARAFRRYSDGGMPTNSVNRVLNEPRLEKPTIMQISVTVRFTERSRSLARSTRRLLRYRPGVSP